MRHVQVVVLRVREFDPRPLLKLQIFLSDVVAEWLTRLTANQFLSGAQVRVLPTSCGKAKKALSSLGIRLGRGFDPRMGHYWSCLAALLAQSAERGAYSRRRVFDASFFLRAH